MVSASNTLSRQADSTTPQTAAIEVSGLGKVYRHAGSIRHWLARGLGRSSDGELMTEADCLVALREVSFSVPRGAAFGVIGRNGAGKSTLLQIIAGTLRPSAGECVVRGRVTALLELGSGFNPEFTGRENIYLAGSILGLTRAEMTGKFDEIVQFADIGSFIEQPVKTYSTGMVIHIEF